MSHLSAIPSTGQPSDLRLFGDLALLLTATAGVVAMVRAVVKLSRL